MDIPLNARVYTKDGHIGRSTCLIVNPINQNITHFVLSRNDELGHQELAPTSLIKETTPDMILLNCHTHELADLEPFTKSEFVDYDGAEFAPGGMSDMVAWPYSSYTDLSDVSIAIEQIPYGELGIHRGAQVEATDGAVGRVGEFLVEPEQFHITHLVLHENHFWGDKSVTIPVSAVKGIEEDVVRLKLTRAEVKQLPHLAVHR